MTKSVLLQILGRVAIATVGIGLSLFTLFGYQDNDFVTSGCIAGIILSIVVPILMPIDFHEDYHAYAKKRVSELSELRNSITTDAQKRWVTAQIEIYKGYTSTRSNITPERMDEGFRKNLEFALEFSFEETNEDNLNFYEVLKPFAYKTQGGEA